jgi:hypothetical protein
MYNSNEDRPPDQLKPQKAAPPPKPQKSERAQRLHEALKFPHSAENRELAYLPVVVMVTD